jgi:hypothetical protein
MLKLKIQLDPKNAKQMLALSSFAAVLAEETDKATQAVEAPAPKADADQTATETTDEIALREITEARAARAKQEAEAPKQEDAPKRKRRTRAEIEAEKAAQEEEEEEEEDDADDADDADAEEAEDDDADAEEVDETESASGVTLDDIRRAVAEKKAVHLQVMKFKLKEGFNASKLDDLKPAQFAAFYKFVSAL